MRVHAGVYTHVAHTRICVYTHLCNTRVYTHGVPAATHVWKTGSSGTSCALVQTFPPPPTFRKTLKNGSKSENCKPLLFSVFFHVFNTFIKFHVQKACNKTKTRFSYECCPKLPERPQMLARTPNPHASSNQCSLQLFGQIVSKPAPHRPCCAVFIALLAEASEVQINLNNTLPMAPPAISFKPAAPAAAKPYYPPGALVPGQRPDRALNSAQFAAATQARAVATSQGLTGRAYDVFVAQAAMNAK